MTPLAYAGIPPQPIEEVQDFHLIPDYIREHNARYEYPGGVIHRIVTDEVDQTIDMPQSLLSRVKSLFGLRR